MNEPIKYKRLNRETVYYPYRFELPWPYTFERVQEIQAWCEERFHVIYWYFGRGTFNFRYEHHAMEFRMRWC